MELKIVDFLENEGEQTIRRQLDYIKKETAHIENQPEVLHWVIDEGLLPSSDAVNLYGKVCENIAENQETAARLQEQQSHSQEEEVSKKESIIRSYFGADIASSVIWLLLCVGMFFVCVASFYAKIHIFLPIFFCLYFVFATIFGVKSLIAAINGKRSARGLAKKVVEREFQENEEMLQELSAEIEELYSCTSLLEWYTDRNGLLIKNVSAAPVRMPPIA